MDGLKRLNLLFLEDNEEFAKNTSEFLSIYFKKVLHASTIEHALELYDESRIDVIISDIKVGDGNGLDFIKSIRESDKKVPIVILSAHKDEKFLFNAIPLNIISYELKPLSYEKFIALLKSIADTFEAKQEVFIYKELTYSFKSSVLSIAAKEVQLTKKERFLLELLIDSDGEVLSNEIIQKSVYEERVMSDSALKNLILRLRKKLKVELIDVVAGVGYRLNLRE